MKNKTIAVVGHGLVPSTLTDKLLNEDDNEIVIIGSLENEAIKKVVDKLESEGKKITVISEEDFKKREMEKTSLRRENKTYMLHQSDSVEYEYTRNMTKKQMNEKVVPVRTEPKYQNNEPCPCGSGNKYKKCCKSKS